MALIAHFGQRPNGSFVGEIAGPGEDISTASGRRLFSTDVGLVQVISTGVVAFRYKVEETVTNGPFGPVSVFGVFGVATYVFPQSLSFVPEITMTLFITQDDEPIYIYGSAPGSKQIVYRAYTDHVDISYSESFDDLVEVTAFSARVSVLSLPWDQS